jgi:hypothetical protein
MKTDEMGRACSTYWGEDKYKVGFDEKKRREESNWEV